MDEEVAHPDNSLSDNTVLASSSDEGDEEDEDDSSSLSSKGDGERLEESLVRVFDILLCLPPVCRGLRPEPSFAPS